MNQRILIAMAFLAGCTGISWGQLGQPRAVIAHDFGAVLGVVTNDSTVYDVHRSLDGWIHLAAYDDHGCCEFASSPQPKRKITSSETESMLSYASNNKSWAENGNGIWMRSDGAWAKLNDGYSFVLLSTESVTKSQRNDLSAEIKLEDHGRVSIKNASVETWKNVLVTINPNDQGVGYSMTAKELKPENRMSLKYSAFCKPDGSRFDFERTMVMSISVDATDKSGKRKSMSKKFGYSL